MPTSIRALAAAVLAAALVGCGRDATGPKALASAVAAARQRWAAASPSDYTFTASRACECLSGAAGPARVVVRGGNVTDAKLVWNDSTVATNLWFTVPQLFDLIEHELAERPDLVEAAFDSELGYPTSVKYGQIEVDAGAVITVMGFTRP
jgi:hypothetical protein